MLQQLSTKQVVKVAPPFPITVEDYAVAKFAETGRTVKVTRWGESPIQPFREYDERLDIDLIIKVASPEEIKELMKIGEMRKRFQILESVPYTDIIIGHEVPTKAQVALAEKRKENFHEGVHLFGTVAYVALKAAFTIAMYTIALVVVAAEAALCGKDPVVWARTTNGAWIEVARWYE